MRCAGFIGSCNPRLSESGLKLISNAPRVKRVRDRVRDRIGDASLEKSSQSQSAESQLPQARSDSCNKTGKSKRRFHL